MGAKYKEKGGGSATGLADNLIGFLNGGLTGTFGGGSAGAQSLNANPMASTGGIANVLNDILSGGAGKLGGSMADMIHQTQGRNVDELRSRYGAAGGMSMGTPAAYAESMMRASETPQLTQAIGGLQLQAMMPIMQMMQGLASKGIAQREGMMQPSGWSQAAGLALPVAGSILGGPLGGSIGSKLGGMFGGGSTDLGSVMGGSSPTPFAGFDIPMPSF
jgi:hypothetical protein